MAATSQVAVRRDSDLAERLQSLSLEDPDFWSFRGRAQRDHGHGLMQYPAMMVPQMVRTLIRGVRDYNPGIRRLADPFIHARLRAAAPPWPPRHFCRAARDAPAAIRRASRAGSAAVGNGLRPRPVVYRGLSSSRVLARNYRPRKTIVCPTQVNSIEARRAAGGGRERRWRPPWRRVPRRRRALRPCRH